MTMISVSGQEISSKVLTRNRFTRLTPYILHGRRDPSKCYYEGVQNIEITISKPDGIADVVASLELARVAERHLPIATCTSVAAP